MVICIFFKFRMVKVFKTLQILSIVKMNIFQMKISNKITLLLILICSFINFKVLVSLPANCPKNATCKHNFTLVRPLNGKPVLSEQAFPFQLVQSRVRVFHFFQHELILHHTWFLHVHCNHYIISIQSQLYKFKKLNNPVYFIRSGYFDIIMRMSLYKS